MYVYIYIYYEVEDPKSSVVSGELRSLSEVKLYYIILCYNVFYYIALRPVRL